MLSTSSHQQQQAILELTKASKMVVEGVNRTYPAFLDLSLQVYPGERLGIFAVNGYEAKTLVECLSGVEALDEGWLEQRGTVSWPLGSNNAFSSKLSGYVNARFAAEMYSRPGCVVDDIRLIQELAGVASDMFYRPISDWPGGLRDSLKLAVSLAFEFDVIAVGKIGGVWNHRSVLPAQALIRQHFERRIDGRTLVVSANGQPNLALDYCDEGLAIVKGRLAYRGDPEVCFQLVKEESKRQKMRRQERVEGRIALLLDTESEDDVDGEQGGDF